MTAAIVAGLWVARFLLWADSTDLQRPPIHLELGKVRPALKYRIVSFHRGQADKRLIRLAAELGFNGVQFQIEGSTLDGIDGFAKRDAQEHLVEFCHHLGMTVTIWVHELSDLPPMWSPEWMGYPTADNTAFWQLMEDRYDHMLRYTIPQVDGLALTVVETQMRATDPWVMLHLCDLLRRKCEKYNKTLMVRTFVWYPSEFGDVMAAVNQLPADQTLMCKCVPQDWNLRGVFAGEIGHVGGRPLIVEYDAAGEYFLRNNVANCMPDLLKKHFDYDEANGISGICVRVDRYDDSVLNQPSEINLWTLGMLAGGMTDNLDDVWRAWATNRFGAAAADGVRKALQPTADVVAEMLCVGPFTLGDTRYFPPGLGDEDLFGSHWQNQWWDTSFAPLHKKANDGDEAFTAQVAADKKRATALADACLANLELVRNQLKPQDYEILRTRLVSNQVQLSIRAPMALAVLHYRGLLTAVNDARRQAIDQAMQDDLQAIREAAMPKYGKPTQIDWLGEKWDIGVPLGVPREDIYRWVYDMDLLRQGIDPRPTQPRRFDPDLRPGDEQ